MTHLKVGQISADDWNNTILPLVKDGTLKDHPELVTGHFFVYCQVMDAVVEDVDGHLYRCVGWTPPGGMKDAHVDITLFRGG